MYLDNGYFLPITCYTTSSFVITEILNFFKGLMVSIVNKITQNVHLNLTTMIFLAYSQPHTGLFTPCVHPNHLLASHVLLLNVESNLFKKHDALNYDDYIIKFTKSSLVTII